MLVKPGSTICKPCGDGPRGLKTSHGGEPSRSYHWPCSLRKIPEMKMIYVHASTGRTTEQHSPSPRPGGGRTREGYPGVRRKSPGHLLPGAHVEPPRTGVWPSREAQESTQVSSFGESLEGQGGPLPTGCAVLPLLGTPQGNGGCRDGRDVPGRPTGQPLTMEEKAGPRESGPVA